MAASLHLRRSSLRRALALTVLGLAAGFAWVTTAAAAPSGKAPWKLASDLRTTLAEAETALIVDGPEAAAQEIASAGPIAATLAEQVLVSDPDVAARIEAGVRAAERAVARGEDAALAAARADVWTAVLLGAYRSLLAAVEAGDAEKAREWLLVREFRKPTRFSRPGADATLAVATLTDGRKPPVEAAAAVRADLLDTYQARLLASLDAADEAVEQSFAVRASAETALARGYFAILEPSYAEQQGTSAAQALAKRFEELAASALANNRSRYEQAREAIGGALAGFRAAPLSAQEQQRRAAQFLRFLPLVGVEYGRGVEEGRVTKDFEIQEAITFRDGAGQALGDLEYVLMSRDSEATGRIGAIVDQLGADLALAARGEQVADPAEIETLTKEALALADRLFPEDWQNTSAADFDVIRTSLDRVVNAAATGEYAKAEQARLEAYAFFELGPEQRLRGLAPDLFVRTEGLFWYGADEHPGLAQLLKSKASVEEVAATRQALDQALADAEAAVGSGPQSTLAVVTNTAIIVFREGLEAVLILAALTAGLVGARRRFRRPLFAGAAGALVASVATFAIAQTVLESLTRYGERLEAIVSLIAIAVLLLILNWFYHKVYWSEHLAELHGRKKALLRGAGLSVAAAQLAGLAMLGFSSVYREGFETVLFLQAIVLDAGIGPVVEGVALGLLGAAGIGFLTVFLQRKLPHKRMLELTGLLILGVLLVMVGKTVQVCQVVGWVPVHPIPGVHLPYWAGAWLGAFPTWEGALAQGAALLLVLGSYFGAEWARGRRRRRRFLEAPPVAREPQRAVDPEPEPVRVESPV